MNGGLCRNLVEHFDFVVIDKSIWLHLSSWYQFDVKICRRLIWDPQSNTLKLDLFPEDIKNIKQKFNSQRILTTYSMTLENELPASHKPIFSNMISPQRIQAKHQRQASLKNSTFHSS